MNDDKLLIEKIANHYGFKAQLDQTVEELSELILAIQKLKRQGLQISLNDIATYEKYKKTKLSVEEELVDVRIMIDQLEFLLEPISSLSDIRHTKLMRQIERIEKEKACAVAET